MSGLIVNLGERSYQIHISPSFENLSEILVPYKQSKVLVVTDSNVDGLYSNLCIEQIEKAGLQAFKFVFPAGEESKNLKTVSDIYKYCKENKFERKDIIIALGGGVAGDMAGFAAATYLRGIDFIQVPTSVIAQCDSSVGGKVGVDFEGSKNIIGAFHQPKTVYININTLKTLPEREFISGLAEVVKHGVIRDEDFFKYLEENVRGILHKREDTLSHIVKTNCSIKAGVVEIDERESGLRAILNFGHTVGHAVESESGFALLHGECVSLGMAAACSIAKKMGMLDNEASDRVVSLLERLNLPVRHKGLDVERVFAQMYYDKKIAGGRLTFVLPVRIGEVVQSREVSDGIIKEAIMELM